MRIRCEACKGDTEFEDTVPLERREHSYIDGFGQLCAACHKKVSGEKEVIARAIAREEAKKYNLIELDPCKHYDPAVCPNCFMMSDPIGILLDFVVYKCWPCATLFRKEDQKE